MNKTFALLSSSLYIDIRLQAAPLYCMVKAIGKQLGCSVESLLLQQSVEDDRGDLGTPCQG